MPTQISGTTGIDQVNAAEKADIISAVPETLGVNQTWQNMTASRAYSTNYTNSTDAPIDVAVVITQTAASAATAANITVDGIITTSVQVIGGAAGGEVFTLKAVVPVGGVYRVNTPVGAGGGTLSAWNELRA